MDRKITFTFSIYNPVFFWIYDIILGFKSRVKDYNNNKKLTRKKRRLIKEFHKQNWSDSEVMEMTRYSCGCLDDAVVLLSNKLLEQCQIYDHRLFDTAKKLVISGFDRKWS